MGGSQDLPRQVISSCLSQTCYCSTREHVSSVPHACASCMHNVHSGDCNQLRLRSTLCMLCVQVAYACGTLDACSRVYFQLFLQQGSVRARSRYHKFLILLHMVASSHSGAGSAVGCVAGGAVHGALPRALR
jgi:hypothetical protein